MDYSHAVCGGARAQSSISAVSHGKFVMELRQCGSVDIQSCANPWNRVSSCKLLGLCALVN